MEDYRLYFLDDQSHIQAVHTIHTTDDEAARLEATRLLSSQQKYHVAELWQLGRRVALLRL
jgi:hypothetical protein